MQVPCKSFTPNNPVIPRKIQHSRKAYEARVQALTPVLLVLLATMVLDYVTGLVKAGITGEINSTKGWQGLLKKVMHIVTVAAAFIADYVAHYTAEQFGWEMEIAAYFALDGICFECLAEEFHFSVQQTKTIVYRSKDILLQHI